MAKIIRLTESDLVRIVNRVINEGNDIYGWVKYPNDKTYIYQKRKDIGWVAKNEKTKQEFTLGNNPKYASSVKKLDDTFKPKFDAVTNKYEYGNNPTK